ncbi:unnamed protein product [Didymodactylos carnosus]|uniref:Uncharacterized protein n=1 Tax=Didymodactylos carnosus TaxID=1234261 RepID=A0A8S2VW69_9BILA|nr:unnamed protein product [Didymodactylos carnosus]CAF4393839.1 unnamed protein product [Didymodactylos carnosus]
MRFIYCIDFNFITLYFYSFSPRKLKLSADILAGKEKIDLAEERRSTVTFSEVHQLRSGLKCIRCAKSVNVNDARAVYQCPYCHTIAKKVDCASDNEFRLTYNSDDVDNDIFYYIYKNVPYICIYPTGVNAFIA